MTTEEIDRLEEMKDDARDVPDPRDKPYFSRWTISGKLNQDAWSEVEYLLSEFGIRVERTADVV